MLLLVAKFLNSKNRRRYAMSDLPLREIISIMSYSTQCAEFAYFLEYDVWLHAPVGVTEPDSQFSKYASAHTSNPLSLHPSRTPCRQATRHALDAPASPLQLSSTKNCCSTTLQLHALFKKQCKLKLFLRCLSFCNQGIQAMTNWPM